MVMAALLMRGHVGRRERRSTFQVCRVALEAERGGREVVAARSGAEGHSLEAAPGREHDGVRPLDETHGRPELLPPFGNSLSVAKEDDDADDESLAVDTSSRRRSSGIEPRAGATASPWPIGAIAMSRNGPVKWCR